MKRGEIWWASLAAPRGSGPGYRRPVVVVQSDEFNRSSIQTVVVAVVTSNMRLAQAPGNMTLSRRESRLKRKSVVNVSQLLTVDRTYLTKRISSLSESRLRDLDNGLRLVLSL